MSLLEDIFLENEAGEAQELERIIEGDDFDERPRSRSDSDENSAKEDEAEEEKTRVDPTSAKPKRVIKNPRFVLNPARLTGPRGIQVVAEHFKDFKFKGKGHEKEDLDLVLKKLEHWAYRLYPKFQFMDCLKKIETLGKKRPVAVHLHRIRMDQISSEETVVQKDSSDDEAPAQEPEDEFDKLLQQQIEIARATPAPSSVKKTPFSERSSMMPKASSSPSINDEQRERMLKNRRMAEERRLAKLKQNTSKDNIENDVSQTIIDVSIENKQRSVIESSDEDVTNDSNKRDTIDVTKSPKCYVRTKKHKSDDHSDNVINRSVTIDSHDGNNVILELDDDGKVVSEPKKYIPAKKHNKSRIDSSDDDTLVVNEVITVDVDKHNTNTTSSKTIQNSIVLDDDHVINESANVDHRQHRPTIDSSESEDEAVVMNESISVDIHGSNIHVTSDSNTHVTNDSNAHVTNDSNAHVTNDSNKPDTSNIVTSESYKSDTSKNDIASLNETDTIENNDEIMKCRKDKKSDDQIVISFCNNNAKTKDNTTKVQSIESNSNVNQTTPQNHIEIDVNEIMDVDFSDDF